MTPPAPRYRYHAFLSYRHTEPDRGFTLDLLRKLEAAGFTIAIDERDFRPRATFLEEMERCIRESHFTLAVLSPRYFLSGNTQEESIITKVLDMTERHRRLIPLTLEPVERPVWLYNIVGVDFSAPKPLVDPFKRLIEALREGVEGDRDLIPRAAEIPGRKDGEQAPAGAPSPPPPQGISLGGASGVAEAAASPRPVQQARPARKLKRLSEAALFALLDGEIVAQDEGKRPETVLQAIGDALPLPPESFRAIGLAAWALDYFPGRSALANERHAALTLRQELLAPLRERRRHPDPPDPSDEVWAEIPAGSFVMGTPKEEGGADSERPAHTAKISRFRLLVHPVTNREYRGLHAETMGDDELPVVNVDWYAAYCYAAWLGGRLPTEAEWEYAARAGCRHAYAYRYGVSTTLERVGWYSVNSGGKLQSVELLEPNPWGLYDMIGNVWEWVGDWIGPYTAQEQADPWGPPGGSSRLARGGCYSYSEESARAACRSSWGPGFVNQYFGSRVVLPGDPKL